LKLFLIAVSALAISCSTAKKNTTTDTKSDAKASTTTAQNTTSKDDMKDKHEGKHKHHHHHEKGEETAKAESAGGGKTSGEVHCKSGGDERTIAVSETDDGCQTNYTKEGKTSSVANGAKGSKHCGEVMEKIQKHLEDAGYKCE
jgi:hypothetical protein